MGLVYEFDSESLKLTTSASGDISLDDMNSYFDRVLNDDRVGPRFVELFSFVDIVELRLSYSAVAGFGKVWRRYLEKGCLATVIYAPSDLAFGIARMVQTVVENGVPESAGHFLVFRELEAAESAATRILLQG